MPFKNRLNIHILSHPFRYGLGLSAAKAIIIAHKGKITAWSDNGKLISFLIVIDEKKIHYHNKKPLVLFLIAALFLVLLLLLERMLPYQK